MSFHFLNQFDIFHSLMANLKRK